MAKRKTKVLGVFAVAVAGLIAAALWSGHPQVFGTLPSGELAAVRTVLDANAKAALPDARTLGGTTGLAEWVFERRDRRLLRLQIESTNRVLAVYRTANHTAGRILVLTRGKQGWWISGTNSSVLIK